MHEPRSPKPAKALQYNWFQMELAHPDIPRPDTLKSLERDGLVRREFHAEIPPRVEYSITDLGMSLLPVAQGFADWALEHGELIENKRAEFDLLVA